MNLVEQLIERDNASAKRIAVIGDSMIDEWVEGWLEDSQDGVQKFIVSERMSLLTPGGAAGAARQLWHWKSHVHLYSILSRCYERPDLRKHCIGINLNQCPYAQSIPRKQRYLMDSQIVFRADYSETRADSFPTTLLEEARLAALRVPQEGFDAVLISDYDKGFLNVATIQGIIELCCQKKIPVVADAKREPCVYEGALLKCNNDYYNKHNDALLKLEVLVRTFGAETPDVYFGHDSPDIAELPPVQCVNHVGAGDCFAAHLILALAHGFSLEDAATIAHSAGRVYVQRPFGQPPRPEEISADLTGQGACARTSE